MTLNRTLFAWLFGLAGGVVFMQSLDHRLIFGNWGHNYGFAFCVFLGLGISFLGLITGILDVKEIG